MKSKIKSTIIGLSLALTAFTSSAQTYNFIIPIDLNITSPAPVVYDYNFEFDIHQIELIHDVNTIITVDLSQFLSLSGTVIPPFSAFNTRILGTPQYLSASAVTFDGTEMTVNGAGLGGPNWEFLELEIEGPNNISKKIILTIQADRSESLRLSEHDSLRATSTPGVIVIDRMDILPVPSEIVFNTCTSSATLSYSDVFKTAPDSDYPVLPTLSYSAFVTYDSVSEGTAMKYFDYSEPSASFTIDDISDIIGSMTGTVSAPYGVNLSGSTQYFDAPISFDNDCKPEYGGQNPFLRY